MPGPTTQPSDVPQPIPGAEAQAPQAPEIPAASGVMAARGPASASAPPATAESFLAQAGAGAQAPMTAEDFLRLAVPAETAPSTADAEGAGFLESISNFAPGVLGPLAQVYNAFKAAKAPASETPTLSATTRVGTKVGKSSEEQRRILESLLGPGYETRVRDGEVEYRKAGTVAFRPVDPKGFRSLTEAFRDLGDLLPDVVEGGIQGITTGAGAAAGLAASGLNPLGAVAGGAAAGAASAVALSKARDAFVQHVLGAEPTESDLTTQAIGVGLGALGGGVTARVALRSAPKVIENVLRDVGEGGLRGQAVKANTTMSQAMALFRDIASPVPLGKAQTGSYAQSALDRVEGQLDEQVAVAWGALRDRLGPDARVVPKEFAQQVLEYATAPTTAMKGDRALRRQMMTYARAIEDGGFTVPEFERILKDLRKSAGVVQDTFERSSYKELQRALARDRDALAAEAVKGTDLEPVVTRAFSDFRSKIDAVREVERVAEKSPEKFAAASFRDLDTAKTVRDVLGEDSSAWSALQSSWLNGHIAKAGEGLEKIGMTDVRALYDSIAKNPDLAVEVLGKERLASLKSLAIAWDKLNVGELLQNPNSSKTQAFLRGVVRTAATRRPADAAVTIQNLTGGNAAILDSLQTKGLPAFAEEAKSVAERSYWLKVADALGRLRESAIIQHTANGVTYKIPAEIPAVSTILEAGLSQKGETPEARIARASAAYDSFSENERLREIREAPVLGVASGPAGKARGKRGVPGATARSRSTLPKFSSGRYAPAGKRR